MKNIPPTAFLFFTIIALESGVPFAITNKCKNSYKEILENQVIMDLISIFSFEECLIRFL